MGLVRKMMGIVISIRRRICLARKQDGEFSSLWVLVLSLEVLHVFCYVRSLMCLCFVVWLV